MFEVHNKVVWNELTDDFYTVFLTFKFKYNGLKI